MSLTEFKNLYHSSIQEINFINQAPLFYEGQFLPGIYFVKSGSVQLLKRNKVKEFVKENQIIGIEKCDLLSQSRFKAIVEGSSEILFVSRYDALKRIN